MSASGIGQFIPLILIFVIFYFFLIRPQQKKVKEHKIMVEGLKIGDKIITSGGIIGTVERVWNKGYQYKEKHLRKGIGSFGREIKRS